MHDAYKNSNLLDKRKTKHEIFFSLNNIISKANFMIYYHSF